MSFSYLNEKGINEIKNYLKNYADSLPPINFFYTNTSGKVFISDIDLLNNEFSCKIINIGIYFGKFQKGRFRLSTEGCNIVNPKRNYMILKEESLNSFLYGESLLKEDFENPEDVDLSLFLPVKFHDRFLGCVLYNGRFFMNFISKGRRIKYNRVI